MDVLSFIVKLTEVLAWPLTLVTVLVLLRKQIRILFESVSKFKYKDLEIEVKREFLKTQEENKKLLPSAAPASEDPLRDRYLELVEVSPKTVVVENWKRVEKAISQILLNLKHELTEEDFRRPIRIIDKLFANGLVDEPTFSVIKNMYLLRNKVVHFEPLRLSRADAELYYENTLKMLALLREVDAGLQF